MWLAHCSAHVITQLIIKKKPWFFSPLLFRFRDALCVGLTWAHSHGLISSSMKRQRQYTGLCRTVVGGSSSYLGVEIKLVSCLWLAILYYIGRFILFTRFFNSLRLFFISTPANSITFSVWQRHFNWNTYTYPIRRQQFGSYNNAVTPSVNVHRNGEKCDLSDFQYAMLVVARWASLSISETADVLFLCTTVQYIEFI